ncbi:MAG: dUTP diphosphatase [Phascolarctobacterium sp.]|nr:dUTP diphosphatase [Phascolarctobacterium sp.]
MQVKIELVPGGTKPEKKTPGAAAYDCYARENKILVAPAIIPLGFKIELPQGYHAEIVPRSSIGLMTTLRMANSVGIIDSDYRGEVGFIGESSLSEPVVIKKGDRIAQMLIKRDVDTELVVVEKVSTSTERGEKGFGSTGK